MLEIFYKDKRQDKNVLLRNFLLRHVYQVYTTFKFPLLRGFPFDVGSLQKQFINTVF